jgi:hypothetical protein
MVHSNGLDPSQVCPYVDLSSLVSLVPKKLRGLPLVLNDNAEVHQLSDGHWHIAPSLTSPSLPNSAIIHDVATEFATFKVHDLTATKMLPNHYWRVPVGTTSILAYLLHHVAHPNPSSKSEEVRLAIELRALLMRYVRGGGPGYGRGHLGGSLTGGGNVGNKSQRKRRKKTLRSVSAVKGQTLRGHTQPLSVHETFHTTMGRAWSQPNRQRASITAVRQSLLSRLPFHPTHIAKVTPFIPTMSRLQHRLMRFM